MKLLIDTHLLLWAASEPHRLSAEARGLFETPEHQLLFSAASFWEITIKRAVGRADFSVNPQRLRLGLLANGYQELAISSEHAMAIERLPAIRKDPFDRILLAQAEVEGVVLLTADATLSQYGGPVRKV